MKRDAKNARTATASRPPGFAGAMGMALLLMLSPSREAAQQIVLRVGDPAASNVIPGQVIEIPIVVDMANAAPLSFAGVTFTLGWQPDKLTFVSASLGEFGAVTVNQTDSASGQLVVSGFDAAGTTATVQILTLSLKANAEAKGNPFR